MSICAHLGVSICFAPLQPGFLHYCNLAPVVWFYGIGAGDGAQRVEPVPALRLHPLQNQRHCRFAHADDFTVSSVFGYAVWIRQKYGFVLPLVSQFIEAYMVGRFDVRLIRVLVVASPRTCGS